MKNGRKYGTTEVPEKHSGCSKRADQKAETWGRQRIDSLVEDEVIFEAKALETLPRIFEGPEGRNQIFLNFAKIDNFSEFSVVRF